MLSIGRGGFTSGFMAVISIKILYNFKDSDESRDRYSSNLIFILLSRGYELKI